VTAIEVALSVCGIGLLLLLTWIAMSIRRLAQGAEVIAAIRLFDHAKELCETLDPEAPWPNGQT
jgi:hypothetical protein